MVASVTFASTQDVATVAEQCDALLDLANASLTDEHFYQSLPLCVMDAVFSIGVKYESVKKVVTRYCDTFGFERLRSGPTFEAEVQQIPGQKSGIALGYFYMLTGSEDVIKPDRMILRFLEAALGRGVTVPEARMLLAEASRVLEVQYRQMTPRLLDYLIWQYQRDVG